MDIYRKLEIRRHALMVVTGLVVAYVRNALQYGTYSWDSILDFLGLWSVHYIAVALAGAVFAGLMHWAEEFFLGKADRKDRQSTDEAWVNFCMAVLVSALAVFLIAHAPIGSRDDEY